MPSQFELDQGRLRRLVDRIEADISVAVQQAGAAIELGNDIAEWIRGAWEWVRNWWNESIIVEVIGSVGEFLFSPFFDLLRRDIAIAGRGLPKTSGSASWNCCALGISAALTGLVLVLRGRVGTFGHHRAHGHHRRHHRGADGRRSARALPAPSSG